MLRPIPALAVLAFVFMGLPGIPGLPPVQNVMQGAAVKQAAKALNATVTDEAPIRSSASAVYTTVSQLPGAPFSARNAARAGISPDGSVTLGPGDYQITAQVFCMQIHAHSPASNVFRLAPLLGKWSDIIAAAQARGTLAHVPHNDLQMLSWQLQAGLKYEELSARSRSLVDQLIPEYRARLNESYLEKIQSTWNRVASTIPGVPSLDSMLDQLGDAGRAIRALEEERATLLGYANDYDRVASLFAPHGGVTSENTATTLWSVVSNHAYARLINSGDFRGPGVLEIRVTGPMASRVRLVVAANSIVGLGNPQLAQGGGGVPGGMVGVPGAAVQPLGVAPDVTPAPSPSPTSSPCNKPLFGTEPMFGGVPGGQTMRGFNPTGVGPKKHLGYDFKQTRDAPVYIDLKPDVPISTLNAASAYHKGGVMGSLGIEGSGDAHLVDARVLVQPWSPTAVDDLGGIIGLDVHYQYTKLDGSTGDFTTYVEYEHLITSKYLPRADNGDYIDDKNKVVADGKYAEGHCIGFGPEMTPGATLTAAQLAQHPLVGYLGATENAHVHIQSAYAPAVINGVAVNTTNTPAAAFFDPTLVLGP